MMISGRRTATYKFLGYETFVLVWITGNYNIHPLSIALLHSRPQEMLLFNEESGYIRIVVNGGMGCP